MENLICLGIGVMMGMMLSVVLVVLLLEPRDMKRPPTKDEWKMM